MNTQIFANASDKGLGEMTCISKRAYCLPAGSGGDLELGHSQMDAYLSVLLTARISSFVRSDRA